MKIPVQSFASAILLDMTIYIGFFVDYWETKLNAISTHSKIEELSSI